MLATVLALLIVRLERAGPAGEAASVALTERFIESMDAEIRQMGVGDPALGRQVRSLVGALATRVERWRSVVEQDCDWAAAVARSVYRDEPPAAEALAHSEAELRDLWRRLDQASDDDVAEGKIA